MGQPPAAFTEAEMQHVARARGTLHPFTEFHLPATALVVIDLQNLFLEPGSHLEIPAARGIVPAVNSIAIEVRRRGGTIVWVQNHKPSGDQALHALTSKIFGEAANAYSTRQLALDAHGYQLWPGLDVDPDDLGVVKTRYSALIPGASDLDERLRERGIDTLLIAGAATNVCCESTARDAMMLGYRVVMLADATAAQTKLEQRASLLNIARCFGDVYTTAEILGRFDRSSTGAVRG